MNFDSEYLRFILALILVLGLILLLAWALRRFGFGGMVRHGSKRRLQVLESLPIDPRHRLVLVRRDDTEHLLFLGPTNDFVVEGGIAHAAPAAKVPAARFEQTLAQERAHQERATPERLAPERPASERPAPDRPGDRLDLPTLRAERPLGEDPRS